MLVIRLHRTGRKNYHSYKIVVTDKTKSSTGGRFVEEVGFLNPETKEKILKGERIKYWMSVGAKPSPTIWNLLVSNKIVQGKKIPKHKLPKKPPEQPAQPPAQAQPQPPTPPQP
ncbi:MAG: 30S ribosomal protein S16 [Candidatus Wildermuthbacteria bacterium]|nr:30S ribosomal protein S16 [Candidatus Wildermuthbacteria bacterium]